MNILNVCTAIPPRLNTQWLYSLFNVICWCNNIFHHSKRYIWILDEAFLWVYRRYFLYLLWRVLWFYIEIEFIWLLTWIFMFNGASRTKIYNHLFSLLTSNETLIVSLSLNINCKIIAILWYRQSYFNSLFFLWICLEILSMTSCIKSNKTLKLRKGDPKPIHRHQSCFLFIILIFYTTNSKVF